jgi:hypothetical protein
MSKGQASRSCCGLLIRYIFERVGGIRARVRSKPFDEKERVQESQNDCQRRPLTSPPGPDSPSGT